MATASNAIAVDDLTLFTQGDEQALERIFRSEYEKLVSLGAAELEDASTAPRIVEGAFYEAWQRRASFASPGDLALFLREAVHRDAVRDRARKASLHRFKDREAAAASHTGSHAVGRAADGAAPTTGVNEAWGALAAALHAPPPDPERGADARHDISRHEAASHMARVVEQKRSYRGFLLVLGVAAVVLLFIGGLWRFMGAGDPGERVDGILARSEPRIVSTLSAQRATVPLNDGSSAALGPDSRLTIPKDYGNSMRVVGLTGTAAFTVASSEMPFFVKAGTARMRAVGTIFDVSTFSDAGTIVRVREGIVQVTVGDSTRAVATGESLAISADSAMSPVDRDLLQESVAWTDGRFVIANRPMRELPALLQRWYGIQVTVADTTLLDRSVSLQVPLDSTRMMISSVEEAGNVKYISRGNQRLFVDADKP